MRRMVSVLVAGMVGLGVGAGCIEIRATDAGWVIGSGGSEEDVEPVGSDGDAVRRIDTGEEVEDVEGETGIDGDAGDACTGGPWYEDSDGDGYGKSWKTTEGCPKPEGYVAVSGDCNDTDPSVHPNAREVCNNRNDDCDGRVDEDLTKACPKTEGVCAGAKKGCVTGSYGTCGPSVYGSAYESTESRCDGRDNDCDGTIDTDGAGCTRGTVSWARLVGGSGEDRLVAVAADGSGDAYALGVKGGRAVLQKFGSNGGSPWTWRAQAATDFEPVDVEVGARGEVYVAGTADQAFGGSSTIGGEDVVVVQFAASGPLQWARTSGSTADDRASGVAVGPKGRVYVSGTATAGLGAHKQLGRRDGFVAKYTPFGAEKWLETTARKAWDEALGLAAGPGRGTGTVFLVGRERTATGSGSVGADFDNLVVAFGTSGPRKWTETFGTKQVDALRSAVVTSGGRLYGGGAVTDRSGVSEGQSTIGSFLVAFDAQGDQVFVQRSTPGSTVASLAVGDEGALFGAGTVGSDGYVGKFSWAGGTLWRTKVGASGSDAGFGVAAASGGVFSVGEAASGIRGRTFRGGASDGYLVRVR